MYEGGAGRPETGDWKWESGRTVTEAQWREGGQYDQRLTTDDKQPLQTITVFWGFRLGGLFARLRGVNLGGEKVDDGKKRDKMD